ncbi:ErfK/YbiS/YcfS/YnhG family protein [Nostoc carneum NIES-2107]|nr:ErfK/YbiS/YcfS/YnhG family protein [Nostoc carneum NIES-2107]
MSNKTSILALLVSSFGLLCISPNVALSADDNLSSKLREYSVIQSANNQTQPTHLVISVSRRQVSLYRGKAKIKSYPIAVGRQGWETPTGNFQVRQMFTDPTWINPLTGESIAGGDPENPLGRYWIGFWTDGKNWVGFHGTPNPESVGKAASHGCIRMYGNDVQQLFSQVRVGTPVTVIR